MAKESVLCSSHNRITQNSFQAQTSPAEIRKVCTLFHQFRFRLKWEACTEAGLLRLLLKSHYFAPFLFFLAKADGLCCGRFVILIELSKRLSWNLYATNFYSCLSIFCAFQYSDVQSLSSSSSLAGFHLHRSLYRGYRGLKGFTRGYMV